MKTKQRALLVLLAVAVLLGLALWAVTRSNARAEEAASAAAEGTIPLSAFSTDELEQIEYTYNGETYTLQYADGTWLLAQDPAYHVDSSACDTMRTALMDLNAMTTDWLNRIGAEASAEYFMHVPPGVYPDWKEGAADDTHFREKGARLIAGMIAEDAKRRRLPLAECFR